MKRRFVIALCLASVSCIPLLAQTGDTPPAQRTPAEMVAKRVERLTKLLTLNTDQQSQATTIFTNEQTAVSGIFDSIRTAHKALETAVTGNDTATIASQSTQIGNLTAQQTQARATADAAFYAILTADQKTKFQELHDGRGFGGRRGFGPMGMGFRGGPKAF